MSMSNVITDLIGFEPEPNGKKYSQVYLATHEGERYLPFMNRSFISFSYGGKNIEDFNLIATVSGDRWQKNGYADFQDLTTEYDVINGQFYWNTYFHTNSFDFELSTDGISQQELDEFLRWFKAGQIKELILAEHPNRAILARVSAVPQISMIPFELKKEVKIDNIAYTVSTTEYKGTINLQLTSDDPFWYAKVNVFGHFDASIVYSDWVNANGDTVGNLINDPDILKIVLEDGIPLSSMVKETIALGGSVYATVEAELRSRIATEVTEQEYNDVGGDNNNSWYGKIEDPSTHDMHYYKGARIAAENASIEFATAVTSGAFMSNSGNIDYLNPVTYPNDNYIYFYYAGTAPSPMILEFDMFPLIDAETELIKSPFNKYITGVDAQTHEQMTYNSIFMESINKEELRLTTPNIYTSYNQVINMFDTQLEESWVQIRKLIRDTVHHSIIRKWANKVIDELESDNGFCTEDNNALAKEKMSQLFKHPVNQGETLRASIKIDSKTGESVGTFMFRNPTENDPNGIATITENIQDMLLSNNLIIKDRNFPDNSGNIIRWQGSNNTTKSYSHRLYHNLPVTIYNIHLTYQNLYL